MMQGKTSITKRKYSKTLRLKSFRISPYSYNQGMSEQDINSNGDIVKDFQSTGRTGRRNALADVLGTHKDLSTSDLPLKLEKLTTNDVSSLSEESTSNQSNCTKVNETENQLNSNSSPSSS